MKRNKYDLQHQVKTSYEIGQLIPLMWLDVVPGDQIKGRCEVFTRFLPLVAPIMDQLKINVSYYYVPYRILMRDFVEFFTSRKTEVSIPNLYDHGYRYLSTDEDNLIRYFGITSSTGKLSDYALKNISQLPFRAYQCVYNYFYRNRLIDKDYLETIREEDYQEMDILKVHYANYFNDYFTGQYPNTQVGEQVNLLNLSQDGSLLDTSDDALTPNDIRLGEAIQKFAEKLMYNFQSYTQALKAFFGTSPKDEVLQRPVMLGSKTTPINIFDVDSTYSSVGTSDNPLGTQAGKSNTLLQGDYIDKNINEHGIILALTHIRPAQTYIAGVPKEFIKRDLYDLYFPQFANIGLQATSTLELDGAVEEFKEFGYTERYKDLKFPKSVICGDFVNQDFWHLGRNINKAALNEDLMYMDSTSGSNIFATSSVDSVQMRSTFRDDVQRWLPFVYEAFIIGVRQSGDRQLYFPVKFPVYYFFFMDESQFGQFDGITSSLPSGIFSLSDKAHNLLIDFKGVPFPYQSIGLSNNLDAFDEYDLIFDKDSNIYWGSDVWRIYTDILANYSKGTYKLGVNLPQFNYSHDFDKVQIPGLSVYEGEPIFSIKFGEGLSIDFTRGFVSAFVLVPDESKDEMNFTVLSEGDAPTELAVSDLSEPIEPFYAYGADPRDYASIKDGIITLYSSKVIGNHILCVSNNDFSALRPIPYTHTVDI